MKRVSFEKFGALILLISFLVGLSSASSIKVCKNGCEINSIQEGINVASTGDKVIINDSRMYNETLNIDVENLTLTSDDGAHPIINGGEERTIRVTEEGVNITSVGVGNENLNSGQGFPDTAIRVDIRNVTHNTVISDNIINVAEGRDPALLIGSTENLLVRNNTIRGDTAVGINVDNVSGKIVNNRVDIGNKSLLVAESHDLVIRENILDAESDQDNIEEAIELQASQSVTIQNNRINSTVDAIFVRRGIEGNSNIAIKRNTIDSEGTSILSEGSNITSISNNRIIADEIGVDVNNASLIVENDIDTELSGITVGSTQRILDNSIAANGSRGVLVEEDASEISDNFIDSSALTGISVSGGDLSEIADNRVNSKVIFSGSEVSVISDNEVKGDLSVEGEVKNISNNEMMHVSIVSQGISNILNNTAGSLSVEGEVSNISGNSLDEVSVDGGVSEINRNNVSSLSIVGEASRILNNNISHPGSSNPGIELSGISDATISSNTIETKADNSSGFLIKRSTSLNLRNNTLILNSSRPIKFKSTEPAHLSHDIDRSNTANGKDIVFLEGVKDRTIEGFDNSNGSTKDAAVIMVANSERLIIQRNDLDLDGVHLWNVEDISLRDNIIDTIGNYSLWVENATDLRAKDNKMAAYGNPMFIEETSREEVNFTNITTEKGSSYFATNLAADSGIKYQKGSGDSTIENTFFDKSNKFKRKGVGEASEDRVNWTDKWQGSSIMNYTVGGLQSETSYTLEVNGDLKGTYSTNSEGELDFSIEGSGVYDIVLRKVRINI